MVLNGIELGRATAREASEVLGLSLRHVRRILAAYRKEGAEALAHGNRGEKARPYPGCGYEKESSGPITDTLQMV